MATRNQNTKILHLRIHIGNLTLWAEWVKENKVWKCGRADDPLGWMVGMCPGSARQRLTAMKAAWFWK